MLLLLSSRLLLLLLHRERVVLHHLDHCLANVAARLHPVTGVTCCHN
jgi:hypothetical protein